MKQIQSLTSYVKWLLPSQDKPVPSMPIVRWTAQGMAAENRGNPGFHPQNAAEVSRQAPHRLAVYPVKSRFAHARRVQQFGALTVIVTPPIAACLCPFLWPVAGLVGACLLGGAGACLLGGAWLYRHMQEELLRRPIVRAAQQKDNGGPELRHQPIQRGETAAADAQLRLDTHSGPRLGGEYMRGVAYWGRSYIYTASEYNPAQMDMLGSGDLRPTSIFMAQVRQTVPYLLNACDPLQVRAAIKRASNVAWEAELFPNTLLTPYFCTSVAGVLFRGNHAYAVNMGRNRVLLCHQDGGRRLTVDHGQFEQVENCKRVPLRTDLMAAANLSRAAEHSTHPNASKQRPQVTAIGLSEAQDGVFVVVNKGVSDVLSDAVINTYVAEQIQCNATAQQIAAALTRAAIHRHERLGHDMTPRDLPDTPAVMVIRSPKPGSANTRDDPSEPPVKPFGWFPPNTATA
jgi:hypothetical protein